MGVLRSGVPDDAGAGDQVYLADGTTQGARSDTQLLLRKPIGLVTGTDGVVKVKTDKGSTVKLPMIAGRGIKLAFVQIFNTDTTVTNANIVVFYD